MASTDKDGVYDSAQALGEAEEQGPGPSLLEPIAPEMQSRDFDAKYRNNGKYAARTPQALKDPLPDHTLARGIQELPRLGLQSDNDDDSSEASDEVEQDDDGTNCPCYVARSN